MFSKLIGLVDNVFLRLTKRKYSRNKLWNLRQIAQKNPYSLYGIICKHRYNYILNKAGAYIPLDSDFAERPTFPHWIYGIFISQGAHIGRKCVIFHQVTIGSNTLPNSKGKGAPTIGNNVYIGAGAKIIGNIKVGNNVRIGANCVITTDIPDNCTVVMERPRIILRSANDMDNCFIEYSRI